MVEEDFRCPERKSSNEPMLDIVVQSTTNKGKLHVKERQVDGIKRLQTIWPVKYHEKVGANLFSSTH